MPDMIPASKIATAALEQVLKAKALKPASYHDTGKIAAQEIHLQVAAELLEIIAEPSQLTPPTEAGSPPQLLLQTPPIDPEIGF